MRSKKAEQNLFNWKVLIYHYRNALISCKYILSPFNNAFAHIKNYYKEESSTNIGGDISSIGEEV